MDATRDSIRTARKLVVQLALGALVLAMPATAAAMPGHVLFDSVPLGASAGQQVAVVLSTPWAGRCSVTASRGHSHSTIRARTSGDPVRLTWTVPGQAKSGTYRLAASCRRLADRHLARDGVRMLVRGGRGRSFLWAKRNVTVDLVPAPPPQGVSGQGGNAAFSTDAFHQCTWWADQMRPDIWQAAVAHDVPGSGYANALQGDAWWDAWRWADNAARAGLPEGHTPVVGAIVVFPRRSTTAGRYGHVAYVDAVRGDGSYHVTEYNELVALGPDPNGGRNVAAPTSNDGIVFIYGGPAGTPSFATVNGPAPVSTTSSSSTPLQGSGPNLQGGSSQTLQGSGQTIQGSTAPIQGGSTGNGSGSSAPTPTPTPTPSPDPTPQPPARSIQIGWSGSHSGWIWMTLNGFSTGSHVYTCAFGSGGNTNYTLSESSTPQNWDNGHTCYDLIHGDTVWVVVEGVSSNVIRVP